MNYLTIVEDCAGSNDFIKEVPDQVGSDYLTRFSFFKKRVVNPLIVKVWFRNEFNSNSDMIYFEDSPQL